MIKRALCWRDIHGNPRKDEVKIRVGNLAIWRHSLRTATLLMLAMDDRQEFRREDYLAIWARLDLIRPETDLAWTVNRDRRKWPENYRSNWARVFTWPGMRDPVIWARSRSHSNFGGSPDSRLL